MPIALQQQIVCLIFLYFLGRRIGLSRHVTSVKQFSVYV